MAAGKVPTTATNAGRVTACLIASSKRYICNLMKKATSTGSSSILMPPTSAPTNQLPVLEKKQVEEEPENHRLGSPGRDELFLPVFVARLLKGEFVNCDIMQ